MCETMTEVTGERPSCDGGNPLSRGRSLIFLEEEGYNYREYQ